MAGAIIAATGAMCLTPAAWAASSGSGTATLTVGSGGLSVSSVGSSSMNVYIGSAGTGILGSADWADATGSGAGWNGTVAVSALTDNGSWSIASGTDALANTGAGTYTGTADGIWYKVSVTSAVTGTSVAYSYTSNYTGDTSGTGTATASGGNLVGPVGNEGVTISFSTAGTYSSADSYQVQVGTQAGYMSFSATGGTAIGSVGTTSPPPTYYAANNGQNITTAGLKFLDALPLTGMSGSTGYYTAAPGVSFTPDSNSWAATYSGTVTYSITSGP